MQLDSTTRKLQCVLTAAATTAAMNVTVSYVVTSDTALPSAGVSLSNTNGTTPVDILAAPAASTKIKVNSITIYNADSAAKTVQLILNDNGTSYPIAKALLQVGEMLGYEDGKGLYSLDANGNTKVSPLTSMTSAQLAALLSDETGSGAAVFANNATLTGTTQVAALTASGPVTLGDGTTDLVSVAGKLLIGRATSNSSFDGALQMEGTAVDPSFVRYVNAAAGGVNFYIAKSRGASIGTNTILQNGDRIGGYVFSGANGTGFSDAVYVLAEVDGIPGASADMPGRLVIFCSSDGSATPTERMRISGAAALVSITGALSATTTIKTGGYTVATLPAGTTGERAYVTDATAPTYLGALTGGGAVICPVFKNASAWVSA